MNERGFELTNIEAYINKLIPEERVEGFKAFTAPVPVKPEEPKPHVPIFGRKNRRYKRGV